MASGPEHILDVLRWAHGGDGVAVPEVGPLAGLVVFVPGAVPGDRVRVRVRQRKKRWARVEVVAIERPSPERVAVACPVQDRCGGCPWMAGSGSAQDASRLAILRGEARKRLGWSEAQAAERVALAPAVGARLGYRNRLRLAWRRAPGGAVTLGFRRQGSHRLVDVDACPVAAPELNAAWPEVRAAVAALGVAGEGEALLVAGGGGVAGLVRSAAGPSRRFGPESVTVALGEATFEVRPEAFVQANPAVAGAIAAQVRRLAAQAGPGGRAVELFAGSGALTVALTAAGYEVDAYELDASVGVAFAATLRGRGQARFHACDLLTDGVPRPAPPRPDLVLLDPPRRGAAAVMPWVGACGARAVIMVSCDVATGLRDLAVLQGAGYRIARLTSHDMFPHTGHQEIVAEAWRDAG